MSGLGEEVMLLDGYEPGVSNWPGPAWAYCDSCKDAEKYGRNVLADFPHLGISEEAIYDNSMEGLSDLPFNTSYTASAKLRFRSAPRSKKRKVLAQDQQAQVGMIRNAAADPNSPKAQEIAKLLSRKSVKLQKLTEDRQNIVVRAKAGYKGNLALVKKLDAVVARAALDVDKAPASKKAAAIAKLNRVNERRMSAARDATRYAKLATLSQLMAKQSEMQASLSSDASKAVQSGNVSAAQSSADGIRVLGARSNQLKKVRENQKRLWRLRNTKANYRRDENRLMLIGGEITRLELKSRSDGLSPVETNKLNKLVHARASIRSELGKLENKMEGNVKSGPVYSRPKDPRTSAGAPIDPDNARAYASSDVMARLDAETFMEPEGEDIYPMIERTRDRVSKLAFLNETYLAGFTEEMPKMVSGNLSGYVHATARGLAAASEEMLRKGFQTIGS
jgi:hypothetical protein